MHAMENDQVRTRLDDERARLQGIRDGFEEDGLTRESESESLSELDRKSVV